MKPLAPLITLLRNRTGVVLAAALLAMPAILAVAGPGGTDRPHLADGTTGALTLTVGPFTGGFPGLIVTSQGFGNVVIRDRQ